MALVKYTVEVARPYTHAERASQYALYFTEEGEGNISFAYFTDTLEEAKAYIKGIKLDQFGHYKAVVTSVVYN